MYNNIFNKVSSIVETGPRVEIELGEGEAEGDGDGEGIGEGASVEDLVGEGVELSGEVGGVEDGKDPVEA